MTIVADSTAIILLAKTNLLETLAKRNKIVIPEIVHAEVAKGKEKSRNDSLLTEKLVANGNLKVKTANPNVKADIMKLFNLKGGELEVVSLARDSKLTILSDDKKCINVAKALGIEFITSLDVVITMWKNGVITKERALDCLGKLDDYGWYGRDVIKSYSEVLK
jgi:predicted nucleic acid-binding protein